MTRHARHYPLARIRAGAALLVAAGLAGCGSDPAYSSDLERFGNERGVENTIVDLPGGDRLSVGSPDRHDVVVQRYDAGAGGWTTPEVVHTESQLWTHHINVARAGATVSVSVDYWVEEVLGRVSLLAEPEGDCAEYDAASVDAGELVVAGRDAAPLLVIVEGAFDDVAVLVGDGVEVRWPSAC